LKQDKDTKKLSKPVEVPEEFEPSEIRKIFYSYLKAEEMPSEVKIDHCR
jgi:hypothetical protein